MIHPDHAGRSMKTFSSNLNSNNRVPSSTDVFIRTSAKLLLDHVVSSLLSIHPAPQRLSHCFSNGCHWSPVTPHPLGELKWEPFNRPKYTLLLASDDADFGKQDTGLKTKTLKLTLNNDRNVIIIYFIHCPDTNNTVLVRSEVLSVKGSVLLSMPVPTQTSSKPILDSSLIMMVTHTSELFHPTSLSAASTSSTSSLTDSLNHHTNSV
jgi:hypothetical protein